MSMWIDPIARINRYRRFYASDQPGLLVSTTLPEQQAQTPVDLRTYDFTRMSEHRRYWDRLVEDQFAVIAQRRDLDDDWMPGIVLHYGFGAFGTVYGDTTLTFTEDTCYMDHAYDDWERVADFSYRPNGFWTEVFLEAATYLSERGAGAFMVNAFPNPSPLDVVNLFMGNRLFTDVYEHPDELHALLERATEAVITNARAIAAATRSPWDGVLTFNEWIPQGLVLLEDAADLIAPALYEEFGAPYTERVIDAFGGTYLHHHCLGRQQYRRMAALRGLTVLQISSDPNTLRPADDLPYLFAQVGLTPVCLECTPEEMRSHITDFARGRCLLRVSCQDTAEAQEMIDLVREHSAISLE